jgi:hypothetical protein
MKHNQNVSRMSLKLKAKYNQNHKMQYGALHTHQRRNARSRPMLNIHNLLTAKKIIE